MIDLLCDIVLIGLGLTVLWFLFLTRKHSFQVPSRVGPLVLFGALMLFAGRMTETLVGFGIALSPMLVMAVEALGLFAGLALLGGGMWCWMPVLSAEGRDNVRRRKMHENLQRQHLALKMQSAQDLLYGILKSSLNGVMVLTADRDDDNRVVDFTIKLVNKASEQILGRSAQALTNETLSKQFPCVAEQDLLEKAISVMETGLPYRDERHTVFQNKDLWYQIAAVKSGDGLCVTFADVSDRKRYENKLRHNAEHDNLTGLANRTLLIQRIEQALARARRFKDYHLAVLFLDFDRFKIINDSLGHEVGDQLLISISQRLANNLRSVDTAAREMEGGHLPARLGGDEFVILLDGIRSASDATSVAGRLLNELSQPHQLEGNEVTSTASIGIVTSDGGDYRRAEDILRDADNAMYHAKTTGKARYVIFDDAMHKAAVDRLEFERELRDAAEAQQFIVEYEPIVNLDTGRVAAVEALLRWDHPERGKLMPGDFLDLAEELGLLVPIGRWVIDEACAALCHWQQWVDDCSDLAVHVNLSRQQLIHPDLLPSLKNSISSAGIDPARLRLEVTEQMLSNERDNSTFDLAPLKALGVDIVMDDFGSGQSSLASIHDCSIDMIKIDRGLLHTAADRKEYAALVTAVVTLAHNLEVPIVAEGIETPEQLALVRSLNCTHAQGRLFAAALTADDVEQLLRRDTDLSDGSAAA